MADATPASNLIAVRNTIYEILTTGQSIQASDGRRLDHANLETLRKLERDLMNQTAGTNGATGRNRISYVSPQT